MKLSHMTASVASYFLLTCAWTLAADKKPEKSTTVYPAALFVFEERGTGAKDMGAKVSDIVVAKLGAKKGLYLVEREDLKKTLKELEMNLSGAVKAEEATKIGQLTGAKIIITGSVISVDKKLYLVAKITGTETSRTVSASVEGKASDEIAPMAEKLAEAVATTIKKQGATLVAKTVKREDRLAALKQQMPKGKRPTVMVKIREQHVGPGQIDPAAQTEVSLYCKEAGFDLIDAEEGAKGKADLLITGEGFSETATRTGNLVSVKARVEIKAVDRKTGKVRAVDRQTAVVVDLSEQLAGKAALQEAAAVLAERLLPKLAKE